jgi:hypothetical protein
VLGERSGRALKIGRIDRAVADLTSRRIVYEHGNHVLGTEDDLRGVCEGPNEMYWIVRTEGNQMGVEMGGNVGGGVGVSDRLLEGRVRGGTDKKEEGVGRIADRREVA